MIDLNRTLQLVRGALFDPEPTWRAYLPEAGDWQRTAFLLTGPLIIASTVIAYLLGLMSSDTSLFGMFRPTIVSSLLNVINLAVAAAAISFIFSGLSGAFGGKSSFALGLAATTLAFVPGYVGQALSWLPWIGTLLGLGLLIYSLVLLWKIIPIYLEVPDNKRAGHYILSLLACIVVMFILGSLMSRILYGSVAGPGLGGLSGSIGGAASSADGAANGMFGGLVRQGELMAAAEEDTYTPPGDGKLRDDQVQAFIRVMERAGEMRDDKGQQLQKIADKAENEQQMSMSDFSQMMGGVTELAGLQTAEIEVVKSGGGNWAEHQWVREALRTAWIQKDLNESVAHNYSLYQKYRDRLAPFITP